MVSPPTQPIRAAPSVMMTGKRSMRDRKSTRLNSSHQIISYAVFCLKKKKHIEFNVDRRDIARLRCTVGDNNILEEQKVNGEREWGQRDVAVIPTVHVE